MNDSGFGSAPLGWRAWLGLIVSPVAWAFHHQLGSNFAFAACDRGPDIVALLAGGVAIALIAVAGWLGWRSWKHAGGALGADSEELGHFLPLLSVMAAGLFGLTIAAQWFANLLLPSCFG